MIWLLVHILPRSSFLPDQPGKPRILLLLRRSRLLKSTPNFSSFAGSRGGAVHPWPAGAAEGRRGGPGSGSAGPRAAPRSAAPRRQRAQPRRRGALQGAGPARGRGAGAGRLGSAAVRMQHHAPQGLRLLRKSRPCLIASCALIEMTSLAFFFFSLFLSPPSVSSWVGGGGKRSVASPPRLYLCMNLDPMHKRGATAAPPQGHKARHLPAVLP